MGAPLSVRIVPATSERWPDLRRLFGANGACGGCWCMWWKLPRRDFVRGKGAGNERALRAIVRAGAAPGLLAYHGNQPVGWCAIERREAYPRFDSSRVLAPVDAAPVWSVTCFFVARGFRGRGITSMLLEAAVRHARRHGARIVEGYPVAPQKRQANAFVYTGVLSTFRRAGFTEVARRSSSRPIMRRALR
jgi:GNAT superfamily N-acetyltransferase